MNPLATSCPRRALLTFLQTPGKTWYFWIGAWSCATASARPRMATGWLLGLAQQRRNLGTCFATSQRTRQARWILTKLPTLPLGRGSGWDISALMVMARESTLMNSRETLPLYV